MNRAIAGIALGPHQQQKILAVGLVANLGGEITCRLRRLAIDFNDDVPRLQARIICRTCGTDLLHYNTMDILGHVELLPLLPIQVGDRQTDFALLVAAFALVRGFFIPRMVLPDGEIHRGRLSVPHDVQLQVRARRHSAYRHLQRACVDYLLAVAA